MFNFEVCAYLVKIKEAKFFFASFAPLRETFMVPVYPG